MAGKRFWIADTGPYSALPTKRVQTAAAATIIEKGMLIKFTSNGSPYGTPLVTEDFTIGTDTAIYGLAAMDSTHTATVDGTIMVLPPATGIVFGCKAKSAAAFNTEAEINALRNALVAFDLTSSVYTVETGSAGATNGLKIVGGDASTSTVFFVVRSGATIFA